MSAEPTASASDAPSEGPNQYGARYQGRVLTARYLACTLGDWKTVLLLVGQAPLIGWLCTIVWGAIGTDTPSLYFSLSLAAVWFGCISACREIVKERAIVERERFFGLSLFAYVYSKLAVLGLLGFAQVLLLLMAVEWKIALEGPFVLQVFALWGASWCGIALGLLVSAFAKTQERAVGAIPLLILPQLLFSEFTIPEKYFSTTVDVVEKLMPVRWCYRVFEEGAANDPDWLAGVASLGMLAIVATILSLLVVLALVRRREV